MGKLMGYKLLRMGWPKGLTFIPVPMNRWNKLKRGYNQAELIARGVSQVMCGILETELLFIMASFYYGKINRFNHVEYIKIDNIK